MSNILFLKREAVKPKKITSGLPALTAMSSRVIDWKGSTHLQKKLCNYLTRVISTGLTISPGQQPGMKSLASQQLAAPLLQR